ncbi:hypothetical protein M569_10900 [Genlisea aurea]|uniref:Uncharacterized protein n=1 Tax=Genlisea aurea TaxID=192259 RepID=S8CAG0_9LAMI|nr:hypothetical protein M569_10900 [Genlisea aurea]
MASSTPVAEQNGSSFDSDAACLTSPDETPSSIPSPFSTAEEDEEQLQYRIQFGSLKTCLKWTLIRFLFLYEEANVPKTSEYAYFKKLKNKVVRGPARSLSCSVSEEIKIGVKTKFGMEYFIKVSRGGTNGASTAESCPHMKVNLDARTASSLRLLGMTSGLYL